MLPRVRDTYKSDFLSDCFGLYSRSKVHDALLRSIGHRFHDGRWTPEEDQFHVYHEIDTSATGVRRTASGSDFWKTFAYNPPHSVVDLHWVPTLTRSITNGIGLDEVTIPEPADPSFTSYILELNAQGTEWIAKNRPGNPVASLAQLILEMRDVPRRTALLKARAKRLQDVGSDYLNVEFGWKPFIKDLRKAFVLQQTLEKRLKQLVRDNGLSIRRRSKKLTVTESVHVEVSGSLLCPFGHLGDPVIGGDPDLLDGYYICGPFGHLADPSWPGSCDYTVRTIQDTTTWNCGTFRYYVPDIGSSRWTANAIAVLYGYRSTPATVYEVMPWSWLIDWFANVGDILSNMSTNAVENETLTNSYSMKEISLRRIVEVRTHWDDAVMNPPGSSNYPDFFMSVPAGSESLTYESVKTNKLRQQASPFGFGLKTGDFTPRQLAILAALAVSRHPRTYL